MTTPTIAELLKYVDLQMAAEAFLADGNGVLKSGTELKAALIAGNNHSSKFTEPQALEFLKHWEVIAQKPNTSTGFSGTLFKCILSDPATGAQKDEIVMSFRSTEFIDDSAQDNQATNAMEIKETGFALGQIRDMQAWYKELTASTGPLGAGQSFAVTGYSLGGDLATAFNLLRCEDSTQASRIDKVVTFNGAGVGATHFVAACAYFTLARRRFGSRGRCNTRHLGKGCAV